jgi:ribosomal protein S20
MSIASISSSSSIAAFQDYTSSTTAQASVGTMVTQLEKSISAGNMDTTKTLLQSIEARRPENSSSSDALSVFLKAVGSAVKSGSTSAAEAALAAYQDSLAGPAKASDATNAENLAVGQELAQNAQTLKIVKMTLDTQNTTSSSSDSNSASSASTDPTGSSSSGTLFSAVA